MLLLATFLAMRRLLPALLAASLVLGACGGDDDDDGDQAAVTSIPEETSTSASTTTEPRTVAPDVIPQDESQITEEYVEQVLNELFEVSGEALRRAMDAGFVEEDAIALIEATSASATVAEDINELLSLTSSNFEGIRSNPTALQATVVEVLEAHTDCVFAEIQLDRTGVVKGEIPPEQGVRTFVKLLPATEDQRGSGQNPTSWVTAGLPTTMDGSAPSEVCA